MVTKEEADKKLREVVSQFDVKKSEEILQKFQKEGLDLGKLKKEDSDFIEKVSKQIDYTSEMKDIAEQTRSFGERLNDANLDSFEKVERMYRVGFYTGVVLVASAIGLLVYNSILGSGGTDTTTGTIISGILGGLGIADIVLLLYTPVRELQQSRGNISKLSALYNEWQYISIWSGKTYNILIQKLKKKEGLDSKTEKLLNEMRWLIDLKLDTTIKLAKLMGQVTTHAKSNILKVTINTKPEKVEVNSKVELEADVYGISTSEVEKITYLWTEESSKITINNKDKRKADFTHDKVGEFTIKADVKVGDKHGSAVSKIEIKPKITAKAEPEKTEKDKDVKLIARVEGLDEDTAKTLSYKWKEVGGTGNTITNDDKSEASIKPTRAGNFKFKVTITKDQKEFAKKEVSIKIS